MSSGISSRNPISVHEGGRGGAGNIGHGGGGREYVDGGMYRTEEPGADGKPYSTGRGGTTSQFLECFTLTPTRLWVETSHSEQIAESDRAGIWVKAPRVHR